MLSSPTLIEFCASLLCRFFNLPVSYCSCLILYFVFCILPSAWFVVLSCVLNVCKICSELCALFTKLESSQSPHTSTKTMLFARWQHHLRFRSGLPYAPLKAMITKISKWSRIQDSFRIIPKIESLVVFAIPDMPSKFQKDPSRNFWVILLTQRQTDKQTKSGKNITSLAEVTRSSSLARARYWLRIATIPCTQKPCDLRCFTFDLEIQYRLLTGEVHHTCKISFSWVQRFMSYRGNREKRT